MELRSRIEEAIEGIRKFTIWSQGLVLSLEQDWETWGRR